ncbi:MAG: phosphoenolpyruvate carboxylase [Conexivisphaera sp.]
MSGPARKIPRTMATQHPDNATVPPWSKGGGSIEGDDEVHEAYLAYSFYGVEEVMWDSEGKDADLHVVRKLLSRYPDYFRDHVLGRDVFLTYRLPNPFVEAGDRKVFSETLESIPKHYDIGERFYGEAVTTPVFEAVLPLTRSGDELVALHRYYSLVVAGKEDVALTDGLRVRDLVGLIRPKWIEVIPLLEDADSLLGARKILERYLSAVRRPYMRVFLARSDPAMSYGMVAAVLLVKHALGELGALEEEHSVRIFPILGAGSLPFRGHLSPHNVGNVIEEYGGVWTFTIQSAFRYDYPTEDSRSAISVLNSRNPGPKERLDSSADEALRRVIAGYSREYRRLVGGLARLISGIARHVPMRRARKPHAGLFGYSRSVGRTALPRAIAFTGALYSVGLPPEIFAADYLERLSEEDWRVVSSTYRHLGIDLRRALRYYSPESLRILRERAIVKDRLLESLRSSAQFIESTFGSEGDDYSSLKHRALSSLTLVALLEGNGDEVSSNVVEMARLRRSLG